jgi:hypothetical protein
MLGQTTPQQNDSLQKIENHFKVRDKTREKKLDAFIGTHMPDLEKLLLTFTDSKRLSRAKEIRDDELKIRTQTPNMIEANLRDYSILIDVRGKRIQHDCEDWRKGVASKRICKHINKLILSIDRNIALKLLDNLKQNKNEWKFELISHT